MRTITKKAKGFSLVEVAVAIGLLVVLALGAMAYQYHAVRHAVIAETLLIANRTAEMILSEWKSRGGSVSFDPSTTGMNFIQGASDTYYITVDGLLMKIVLSSNDIDSDTESGIILREVTAHLTWSNTYGDPDSESDAATSMQMSTYVRTDSSGA